MGNLSFHFYEINYLHIREVINDIKASKGFGNDNISGCFLKLALPYISCSLVYMFNKSIVKGEFPTRWKMARVIPVFIKGDTSSIVKYRPISILPVVSRLSEKLVYNQLYNKLVILKTDCLRDFSTSDILHCKQSIIMI